MNHQLDRLLAAYCSPTLAGIKPASLVSFDRVQYADLPQQLSAYQAAFARRGIRFEILCACRGRFLLLVYHKTQLEQHMADVRVQRVLTKFGYPTDAPLEELLDGLRRRIAAQSGFPHEIGLFLGYPIEDVIGFIRNEGRGCKLCGYWKVYGDAEAASRLFDRLSRVCHAVKARVEQGETLLQVFAAA
ncbi:DUF3793 family protein [uncultured Agathobaculum sp.]|uniref:DUF3793 family protein n=1 Tax=uncultured Agathobaculum sp. TaxID=2048140 RepID=UPI0032086704